MAAPDSGAVDRGRPGPGDRAPRRRAAAPRHSSIGERLIAGVPARVMRPRLVFATCLLALVAFGILMVYSASAVEAASDGLGATYYAERQLIFAVGGFALVALMVFWRPAWDWMRGRPAEVVWAALALTLAAVFGLGQASRGAIRWINLGFFSVQPSELIKPLIVLIAARLLFEYYECRSLSADRFLKLMGLFVGAPLALIVLQPDLGSTIIIVVTVFAMAFMSGLSPRVVVGVILGGLLLVVLAILVAPYRMERLLVMLDPWQDPYGSGYQATLAIMAFASGGLFGRGIGNSTLKYNYLPEAHNDYILAIIGEELGFVGTLLFFAVFALLIWSAFKIAREAPDGFGRLAAEGSAIILMVQFLVNALGVLGVIPMTGKTLPFISYGGSSMIASLLLAGIVLRVSMESGRQTVYGARRAEFAVMTEEDAVSSHLGRSTAGQPRRRRSPEGPRAGARRDGFAVYDGSGGRAGADEPGRDVRRGAGGPRGRTAPGTEERPRYRAGSAPLAGGRGRGEGYGRVDLGQDAADRLRERGPRTRRDAYRGDWEGRRDRYDR